MKYTNHPAAKEFNTPSAEVIFFDDADVICTSDSDYADDEPIELPKVDA